MIKMLEELRDAMANNSSGDDHAIETTMRAFQYAVKRVQEGHAKTESEARLAMVAFSDGFCTGFHRGGGTQCTR